MTTRKMINGELRVRSILFFLLCLCYGYISMAASVSKLFEPYREYGFDG